MRYIIIFQLVVLCSTRVCIAQQTDNFHYYLDADQKTTTPSQSFFHLRVYKEKPTDKLYKRDLYRQIDKTLVSTGYSSDQAGMIYEGFFTVFTSKGEISETGTYKNGKQEGEWINYKPGGRISYKYHYHEGKLSGLYVTWYESGKLRDSFALDDTGSGPAMSYYEDGQLIYEGPFVNTLKSGLWKYYYDIPGNHKSLEVEFVANAATTLKCFKTNGAVQAQDCYYEHEAEFPDGEKAWANYIADALGDEKPSGKPQKNRILYTAIVKFRINKDGKTADIAVEESRNIKLDKIAERIIRNSPRWIPAIEYNQKVNAYRRQPITFAVEYE